MKMDEKTLKKSDVDKDVLKDMGISEDILRSPLWDNSEFISALTNCFDVDEIQACFEDNGLEIEDSDASKILCYVVYNIAEDETKFASDYDLELCAGGQKPEESQATSQPISPPIPSQSSRNVQLDIPAEVYKNAPNTPHESKKPFKPHVLPITPAYEKQLLTKEEMETLTKHVTEIMNKRRSKN